MTIVSTRLLIVVRASLRAQGNAVAQVADPETDGDTFRVPLRVAGDANGAVVAYWTSWAMDQAQRDRLLAEFGRRFARSITPIPRGGRVNLRDDYWVFEASEATGWTPDAVLTALGYDILPSVSD